MAIKKFDRKGYGQLEPSQVWFTRAGMSESQCELDPEVFAAHFPMLPAEVGTKKYAEIGQFLMIDKVKKIATTPTEDLNEKGFMMGINYSTEKLYSQFTPGRRNFCMICGEALPRIGFIEPGMRICTNTVSWDSTNDLFKDIDPAGETSESAQFYEIVKETLADPSSDPLYAYVVDGSDGELVIGADVADALGNVYAQVTEAYYNADNTLAFKIMFINKPATT